jgi:hypothetical protein
MASLSVSESHDEEFVHVHEVEANESGATLIRVTPSQTVGELKEAIANEIGSELDEIYVAFANQQLSDGRALSSNEVQLPNSYR